MRPGGPADEHEERLGDQRNQIRFQSSEYVRCRPMSTKSPAGSDGQPVAVPEAGLEVGVGRAAG
eukprot:10311316-Alexandrium_andersonii.AAC.1